MYSSYFFSLRHSRTPERRIEQGVGTAEAASAAAVCADAGVCVSAAAAAAAAAASVRTFSLPASAASTGAC